MTKTIQRHQELYGITTEMSLDNVNYSISNSKSFDYKTSVTGH